MIICLVRHNEAFEILRLRKLKRIVCIAYSSFLFVVCCSVIGALKNRERKTRALQSLSICRPPTGVPLKMWNPCAVNLRLLTALCFLMIFPRTLRSNLGTSAACRL